jgi:steroid delta-isomerase-like uncharacterized protein
MVLLIARGRQAASPSGGREEARMSAQNVAIVRRYTEEGCVGGNVQVVDEVVAEDCVDHDPLPGQPAGRAGLRLAVQMVVRGLSDRSMVLDQYLDAGDVVIQNWILRGRHSGEFLGLPATGKEVRVRGMEIWRVADGRIVERWGVVDVAGAQAQLGAGAAA